MLGRASLFQCIAVALATYVVAAALIGCSPERDANSRLVIAARQGSLVQVKALIAEGVDVNGREMVIGQGRSALFHASAEGHVDVVRYLLERGAEVDEAPAGRSTALIVASWEGHREIVRLLISSRADVNRKNENGGRVPGSGVRVQRDVGLSAGWLFQAIAGIAGRLSGGLSLIGASDSRLM